ncbi:MAG: protein kinase [Clostridiales bacterium]|nr:protein kinase [Clostridiales bacterium]
MADDITGFGPGVSSSNNDDLWSQLLGAAQKQASPASWERGDMVLDNYRVESDPIHGGMGSVWRVRHTGWNVDLAMKRPQPRLLRDEKSREQFIHECRNWILLGLHPNIVSCYYVRDVEGVPTIFAEWMDNGSLKDRIDDKTLYDGSGADKQKRILDVAIQSARGLRYAHRSGLIHQDIKPANLMLTDGWQVKVGDFGLANPRGELTVLTGEATLDDPDLSVASGGYTPAYCSMEQMDGKRLTRRTDIYSWALTVLEMYLGSRLWQNGVVGGVAFRDYLEESDGVPLPDGMEDLLARCLEQDPENRPRDFGIIEEELKKIWRAAFGSDYPRPQPKAAADTAESLNNMALSWLDLGREDLAEDCWDRAVRKNSRCLDAVYNSALHAFRSGRMDDAAAVSAVRAFTISDPDDPKAWVALARVQSECGDEGLPATLDQVESRFPDEYSEDLASMRESADAQRMEEVYRYSGSEHDGPVEITPDGRFLLVHQPMEGGGHRGTECVRFLDAGSHEEISTMIRAEEAGPPAEVHVRASVNPIACFGTYRGDPNVYKWRTSDGKQVQAMVMRKLPREQIVVWDIDARGEWAIIASNHGRIVLMQTDTKETKYLEQIQGQYMVGIARGAGKCLVCLPGQDLIRVEGVRDDFRLEITADSPALALFVREDRDILVIRGGISPTLCLFDAAAGDMRWEVPFPWMEEWQGRQCQHSVSCDGNRVLLRTNSGWVLFSVPDHRWLCTIGEEQLHCSINLILRAYLTGSGDRVYFSDFMSRLTGYSVPEFSRRSPWVLSTIRTTLDSLEEQGKFDALRVQAEAAVNEGFVADALALVAEACAVSGGKFRTDPDLLAVIRRLSPRCRIEQPGQPFILKTWPVFSKEVHSISPSPDGRWIAALSGAGELAVLETETGRVVYRDPARRHAFRKKLQWQGSCFWSIVTGKAGDPDKKANLGGGGGQIGIRFMGQDLLSSSGGEVLCFDMDRLTPDPKENERVFADCPSPCPDDGVTDFLALPDGSCVYRLDSGAVCRYDRKSFPETILETESDVQISGAAVSPDGQYAIQTAGDILNFGQPDSCSGKSVIYRTDSGEVVFRDDSACISPVCAFTGDGRRAVIGQVVVDMNKMLDTIIPCDADCFPDFLDNRFLVTLGTDKLLNVFDMDTAVSVREASVDEKPLSVACSPDRNTLYVGSVKGTISVWFWNHTYVPVEEGLPDAEKGTDPETAGEGPDAGDLWASLLGAARTEAEKQPDQPPEKETPKPSAPAPDDPWAQLLSAAAAEINRQSGPKAAPPTRDNPFAKGATLLDTYLVESEPMHGGMGSVWRVRHSGWNVDLAMKRPQPKMFADESSKQGFIDECRNWIDLGLHPNIVSCYYVREIDGVPAIFSEWMENGDLKHHIDDGTLYDGNEKEIQKRLLDIAIQYARGLRYAHEQGLIHQDVKPANLLLTNDWQAKAADFGLANARAQLTVLEGDVTQQDPGQSLNAAAGGYTPAYCSMEQMDGKALTRRTDIYSWAVSVMEMYYGSRPWTNGVVAGAGCREYLADPDGRVAVPEELRALLAECMEQDPEDRPHDFAVVGEKLLSIYRHVTGDDYPRPEPTAAPDTADSLNNRALSFLDLGMPEKAEMYWKEALEKEPDHPAAVYNLSLYQWRNGQLDFRDMERRCAALAESASVKTDPGQAERLKAQAMAEARNDGPVSSWRCGIREIHDTRNVFPRVLMSPDKNVFYAGLDAIYRCRVGSPDPEYVNADALGDTTVDQMALTPDGKTIVFCKNALVKTDASGQQYIANMEELNRLFVVSAETGKVLRVLPMNSENFNAMLLSPDNQHVYTAHYNNGHGEDALYKRDLETGSRLISYDISGKEAKHGPFRCLCLSPDGQLLVGITSCLLMVWEEATGHQLRSVETDFDYARRSLCFTGDGKSVCTCGQSGFNDWSGFTVWDLETLESRQIPTAAQLQRINPAGKGSRFLSGDDQNRIMLWDSTSFQCLRVFEGHQAKLMRIDASPGLERIVSADLDRNILVWDVGGSGKSAPWEVSRICDYQRIVSQQAEMDALKDRIQSAVSESRVSAALSLLADGERRFNRFELLPLRRELTRRCVRKSPAAYYEITTFPIPEDLMMKKGWKFPGRDLAFHPQGGTAWFRILNDPEIRIWQDTGGHIGTLALPARDYSYDISSILRFSHSGKLLAAGGDSPVLLYDPQSRHLLRELKSETNHFTAMAFSPDDSLLATGGQEANLVVWDTASGRAITEIHTKPSWTHDLCFLPDGKHIAMTDQHGLHLFDLSSGEKILTYESRILERGCFLPGTDPDILHISCDDGMLLWNVKTWESAGRIRTCPMEGEYWNHRFCASPDGSVLVSAVDKTVSLWSVRENIRLLEIQVPTAVQQVSFSPDGCILAALCEKTAHFWSIQWNLESPG